MEMSTKDSPKILGVCLWLAKRFDLDVVGVRLAFLLGIIFTVGTALPIYLIIYLIMPNKKHWL